MKAHSRTKLAFLVLLPLVGCVVIAWLGLHRPERLIVGKWRVGGSNRRVFEFKADGTCVSSSLLKGVDNSIPYRYDQPIKDHLWHIRSWGRYRFSSPTSLELKFLGMQVDDGPVTSYSPRGDEVRSRGPIEMSITDDEVRVISSNIDIGRTTWKRIE